MNAQSMDAKPLDANPPDVTPRVEAPFLAACRRKPTPHTPVWIMRQAGRYLPEYRALRAKHDFATMTGRGDLAAEVTLQPLRRFDLDAAILFSDIMTPLAGMGVGIEFTPGPVIAEPIRTRAQVERLRPLEPARDVPFVIESVGLVRRELAPGKALIGFAGAPFTLFCYLVTGGGSKEFAPARILLRREPALAELLLTKLADAMVIYLAAQAAAGAQALMLFESWAGMLDAPTYARFAKPAAARVLAGLHALGVPLIYFANDSAALLGEIRELPSDVVGIDWRQSLAAARHTLGPQRAVQGNLDPAALFGSSADLDASIDRVLVEAGPEPGHIFNLGHGIWPETDPSAVARLVERVHERTAR
jgi:uroporphyrinogen decarboxylase